MLTASERQTAADALGAAERDRQPIAPLTERFPGIDTEDAYEIQLLGIGRRVAGGPRCTVTRSDCPHRSCSA